jgi:allantoicase
VSLVEVDTSGYIGNSPGMAEVRGYAGSGSDRGIAWDEPSSWAPLLPATPLRPDTPHRFRVSPDRAHDLVRLDVLPDGGVARLRLYGSLTDEGLARLRERWAQTAL